MSDPRAVLASHCPQTPVVRAAALSRRTDSNVFCKVESGLPTGSFKVRGALYAMHCRRQAGPLRDVVAASTGNHGAAVAYAAAHFGIRATIFLPERADPVKRARVESLGARVVLTGRDMAEAAVEARRHADTAGAFLLDDATDPDVPVGASTIAAELLEQLPDPDVVFVPVGDSALIRGVGAVLRAASPRSRLIGVQSSAAPSYYLSWRAGHAVPTARCDTVADGLATRTPVASNVAALRDLVDAMTLVPDAAILEARQQLEDEGIRSEPSGAAAAAAVLATDLPLRGRTVVALVTGGNWAAQEASPARAAAWMAQATTMPGVGGKKR